jgi:hypothetical protein
MMDNILPAFWPDKKSPDKDPIEEVNHYVAEKWFQQLVPLRTQCFRCRADSPMVFVPNGTLAFGDDRMLRRGDRDITPTVVAAFEKIGWRFQRRRSFCPTCKGLGSV